MPRSHIFNTTTICPGLLFLVDPSETVNPFQYTLQTLIPCREKRKAAEDDSDATFQPNIRLAFLTFSELTHYIYYYYYVHAWLFLSSDASDLLADNEGEKPNRTPPESKTSLLR